MVGHGSLTSAEGREVSTNISQSNAMLITPLQTQVFGIMPEPMIKPPNQARYYQHLSCVFSHADKACAGVFEKKVPHFCQNRQVPRWTIATICFLGKVPYLWVGGGGGGGVVFNTQEKRPQ